MDLRKRTVVVAAIASAFLLGVPVSAAAYPTKPVRLVVPFPPGGSTDIVARLVVQKFSEKLGGTVFIDNKGGASGMIGTAEVARAEPDGHTLLIVYDSHATNQHLFKNLKYDTFKSFDYISLMTVAPMLMMTSKSFAPSSIREIVSYAKSKPGGVTYGSAGIGTSTHLNALLLAERAGIPARHIPYKGGGPLLSAILSGEVDFALGSVGSVLTQVQNGTLKPIAVGSKQRVPQLPDTPTVGEVLPGYEANAWIGLVGPAGLPKAVLEKISTAMKQALEDPELKNKLTAMTFQVVASSPAEFREKVANEYEEMGKMIEARGIKIE